jgi:hypothetical protein
MASYRVSFIFTLLLHIYIFKLIDLFSFQIELEKLNSATNEINKLEIELDVSISVNLILGL